MTKFLLFFHLLLTLAFSQQIKLNIWDKPAPGTESKINTEYTDSGRVYNIFQPDLTVYLPEYNSKPSAAIIICPGGGYRRLAIEKEGYKTAEKFSKEGIAAFVLKYRLSINESITDIQRAVSFIRFNHSKFNIKPSAIGVMGFSAGGNVAVHLGINYNKKNREDKIDSTDSRPDFIADIYGLIEPREKDKFTFEPYYKSVHKNYPPTFIVHSIDDKSVPVEQSENLYHALRNSGISTEMHLFQKGGHGFGLGEEFTSVNKWPDLFMDWLRLNGFIQ